MQEYCFWCARQRATVKQYICLYIYRQHRKNIKKCIHMQIQDYNQITVSRDQQKKE